MNVNFQMRLEIIGVRNHLYNNFSIDFKYRTTLRYVTSSFAIALSTKGYLQVILCVMVLPTSKYISQAQYHFFTCVNCQSNCFLQFHVILVFINVDFTLCVQELKGRNNEKFLHTYRFLCQKIIANDRF